MKIKKVTAAAISFSVLLIIGVITIFATSAKSEEEAEAETYLVEDAGVAGEAVAIEKGNGEGESIAERLASFEEFGITYEEINGNQGDIYWYDELLKEFIDIEPDGSILTVKSASGGENTAHAVYDQGKVIGISYFSEDTPNQEIKGIILEKSAIPENVLTAAVDFLENMQGSDYSNWKINSLVHSYTYDNLDGMELQIYQLNYAFLAENPEEVILAGGMTMDDKGWVVPEYPNSTYLVFKQEGDVLSYVTTLFENDCFPGDEVFTNDLRQSLF